MSSREELVITALQERIGQLVVNYETQIAFLRAEMTELVNKEKERLEAVDKYSEKINKIIGE